MRATSRLPWCTWLTQRLHSVLYRYVPLCSATFRNSRAPYKVICLRQFDDDGWPSGTASTNLFRYVSIRRYLRRGQCSGGEVAETILMRDKKLCARRWSARESGGLIERRRYDSHTSG